MGLLYLHNCSILYLPNRVRLIILEISTPKHIRPDIPSFWFKIEWRYYYSHLISPLIDFLALNISFIFCSKFNQPDLWMKRISIKFRIFVISIIYSFEKEWKWARKTCTIQVLKTPFLILFYWLGFFIIVSCVIPKIPSTWIIFFQLIFRFMW